MHPKKGTHGMPSNHKLDGIFFTDCAVVHCPMALGLRLQCIIATHHSGLNMSEEKTLTAEEKILAQLTTYSKDTPIGHPDIDGRAGIFVPSAEFNFAANAAIRMGSGIVGFGNPDGTLTVYFEGNRFDDSSLHKWENKVRKSYDRMVMRAPTVSKTKIDAKQLELVGLIEGNGINVKHPEKLLHWLQQSNAADTAPTSDHITWKKDKF